MPNITMRRDIVAIIAFLVFILLVWAGFSYMPAASVISAEKADGVYDLRGFDFETNILNIHEHGSWKSWPEKLYTPEDFSSGRVTGAPIVLMEKIYTRIQYATHQLQLILPPGNTYGISMKSADYAMRIYINGIEIDCVGRPGATKEESVPRVNDRVYYFTPLNENMEILVQTSNFVHNDGCQPPSFNIGKAADINRKLEKDRFLSAFMVGCFFISGFYHLALFVLNRKRITALVFSICCILMALMVWPVIRFLNPDYNWYIAFQVEYLVHFGTFAMLALLIHKLFPKLYNKYIFRCYLALCGLFALSTFVLSTKVYSGLLIYFQIPSVMMILYTIILLAIAAFRKNEIRTILGFFGVLVICLFAVNDIFYYRGVGLIGRFGYIFTTPVGMLLFVFCYTLIVAIEYAETERIMLAAQEEGAALERLNNLKSDFMRTISHEMRTPLAVIMGFAEISAEDARNQGVSGEISNNLDAIAAEAGRMADMMEEMRQLALAKEYKKDRQPVNIAEVIKKIAGLYAKVLERRGIKLSVEIANDLPLVYGNSSELTQVIFNLLRNADTHTNGGEIIINAQIDNECVLVTVRDTGSGIPSELLPHVFERGTHGENEGSGFGLAICRDIISAYGGEISINNEKEQTGTVVKFTLPVYNYNEEQS